MGSGLKLSKPGWEVDGVDGAAVEERPNLLDCPPPVHLSLPVSTETMQERFSDQPGNRALSPSPHQAALQSRNISQEDQQSSLSQPSQAGRSHGALDQKSAFCCLHEGAG